MSVLSTLMGMMQSDAAGQAAAGAAEAAAPAGEAAKAAAQAIEIAPTVYPGPAPTDLYWLPEPVSVTTESVDWLYYGVLGLSYFCFIGITIAVIYFVLKYRKRPGHDQAQPSPSHNNPLEITWTVIPAIICVFLFLFGWRGYIDVATPPEHALEIQITGQKWFWTVKYPNGYNDPNNELHVPVNRSVRLIMTSNDVLHSFFIPVFRVKQDVVPRRYTELWFKATKPGVYRVYCAEYCGKDHSQMKTVVVVHEPGGYQKYLERVDEAENAGPADVKTGEKVYNQFCIACHTLDGSARVGPSFKNLVMGSDHKMTDGSMVKVDENYLKESILDPMAKIRDGYPPGMTPFKGVLSDKKIDSVILFIKSLNQAE